MAETTTPARFRRSERDKVIGGVAGGLGRYLGIDPVLVRLAFAVAVFIGGIGVLAYVLAWVIVPADDDPSLDRARLSLGGDDAGRVLGGGLVVLAALALLGDHWWAGDLLFPLVLIGLGAWLLLRPERPGRAIDDDPAPASAAGVPPAPPPEVPRPPAPLVPPPPPVEEVRPSGFPTARVTVGVGALLAGILALAAANGADVSLETVLVACLAVCGTGLLLGAFLGRARSLIALAVPLVVALAAVSVIDVPLDGGIGERNHRPQLLADLETEYRLGIGEMVLDLRGLGDGDLRGQDRHIEASVGIGSLQVQLPRGATVVGDARSHLGQVDIDGHQSSGTDARRRIRIDGAEGGGTLELDLVVGIGEVVVR